MLRFLSFIMILLGLAAVGYGGARYFGIDLMPQEPAEQMAEMAPGAPSETTEMRSIAKAAPPAFDGDDDMFSITSVADDMMARLREVPIAHETPSSAKFGRAFDVTVAIDGTGGDSAADALPGTGNIVEGVAQVSDSVMAALSGDRFDIVAVTPMTQTVSPLTENVWRWRVTPTEVGAHDLVIELFALEGDQALPVRTFRDKVEVQVSRVGQVVAIVDSFSPIAVVVGGIGSFLAGLLGALRFFRRR